jgi:hypothetical protein
MRDLEYRLGVDRNQLRLLAGRWRDEYFPFQQAKRPKPHAKIKKEGKLRQIDNPSRKLKQVQTRILDRILPPVLPEFLFGAVPGWGIKDHAEKHLGANTVVKMDIKDYYPSITSKHIYSVWSSTLHCSPPIASLLTKLTTYNWHLPQGAPTSPAIANLFLASIYGPVLNECEAKGVTVTAWVDDLIFSGENARSVMELVRKSLALSGLKLSSSKKEILGPRQSKTVTGVRLGANQLRAPSKSLRNLRAGIHNLRSGRYTERGREADVASITGQIAHVRFICPADGERLEYAFKAECPAPRLRDVGTPPRMLK